MKSGCRPLEPASALRHLLAGPLLAIALLLSSPALASEPWMWDQDEDGLDDRLTAAFLNGITAVYENGDSEGRLRFEAAFVDSVLQYGGYVRFDHFPSSFDSLAMVASGAQVVTRFTSVPYLRVRAFYPSLVAIAAQPNVDRVEAVTLMFPTTWRESAAVGVRPGGGGAVPALGTSGGPTGQGVVVAVLDTGINDEPTGGYDGHVDLAGKVVGGAWYAGAGPVGYTAWNASVNPAQSTPGLTSYHGTHVAGTIAGGERTRLLGGLAPNTRLVDVKVLDDTGTGSGLAEGLEWCLQNRNRVWPGGASGIDVINLSLSAIDPSDGRDCVSQLVNAANTAGLVVVCAAGNDGKCVYIPAPGAADGALTVGSIDLSLAAPSGRPALADFSNEGPRFADGDGSTLDELKPDVVAPGVDVISAWGSPVGSGRPWRTSSGTSMSAAVVSGVVALLREAAPAATANQIKDVVRRTARHRVDPTHGCSVNGDPWGNEPLWRAGYGFGEINALAAWLELTAPALTQFVELAATWQQGLSAVTVSWTTQREVGMIGFHIERAADVNGAPGAWTTMTAAPLPGTGFSSLLAGNRTAYSWTDATAPVNQVSWYRVRTTGGGQSDTSQSFGVRAETPAALARVTLRHNRPELDWTMALGTGAPASPEWVTAPSFAVHVRTISALSVPSLEDRCAIELEVPLYASLLPGLLLPPSSAHPWWFRATEGGLAATTGDITDFRFAIGPLQYVTGDMLPAATSEGATTQVNVPTLPITGVAPGHPVADRFEFAAAVNPSRGMLRFVIATAVPIDDLAILDVTGRLVRQFPAGGADTGTIEWDGRDESGRMTPAGRYFVRLDAGAERRIIAITRLR